MRRLTALVLLAGSCVNAQDGGDFSGWQDDGSSSASVCRADINGDTEVDVRDLLEVSCILLMLPAILSRHPYPPSLLNFGT